MIGAALLIILIIRSLVPAYGVLFLDWQPGRVLILFFLDTILGVGALVFPLILFSSRQTAKSGGSSQIRAYLGAVVGTAILLAVLSIPLGGPLIFMLANTDFSLELTLRDWSFQRSLELQALASLWWCGTLLWRLRAQTPEELGFKPLFGLIVLRWLLLVGITFTGLPAMMGRGGPYFLVIVYCGAMILSEVNPRLFMDWMTGLQGRPRRPGA
jgi:hypothetical protein